MTNDVCQALRSCCYSDRDGELHVQAADEIERLRAALRGLTDMYCRTWDRVDGALVMMPDNIERFEKAHAAAQTALGEALDGDAHEPGEAQYQMQLKRTPYGEIARFLAEDDAARGSVLGIMESM